MSTRHRTLILAVLLVAAGSLAFATGAAVIDGPADTFAEERLAVQPAEGSNGDYAYLNEDDEIVVDISAANPNLPPDFGGINPDALASADGVFTITYTADEYAHVWIDHDGEAVTFTTGDDSIEGEANNVTLVPNETVAVGLVVDTHGEIAGTQLGADEFSIRAKLAEPEAVPSGSTSSTATGSDDAATTVTSPGPARRRFVATDAAHGETIRFEAGGMHLDGENVTLDRLDLEGVPRGDLEIDAVGAPDPATLDDTSALDVPTTPRSLAYLSLAHDLAPDDVDSMTLRFSADAEHLNATGTDPEDVTLYRETAAGDWERVSVEVVDEEDVRLRGLSEDRVHFRATTDVGSAFAVAERVPRFDVTNATLDETAVDPGTVVTATATVTNGGGADGNRTVALTANGETVASETIALDPNETTTVSFDARFDEAGEYDLAVDGTSAGTLLVGDPGSGEDTSGTSAGTGDGPATDDEPESATGPIEEPSAIGLSELVGLVSLLAMVVVVVALARLRPG